mmetsp:Transcript_102042/g.329159  ORF Transcript_102042/g.329159 Transcript_102042/m.329159 type:complete len:272 (-) Transcript_102042:191-1006(-)
MMRGKFSLGGAVRKCWSIALPPSWNFITVSKPYCKDSGITPTALQHEKRPPTQSQKPKTLFESMPKAAVLSRAVEQAATCLATQSGEPSSLINHSLTVLALSIVSAVVKVFETTNTSVVSALRPSKARFTSMGSTFARKRKRLPCAATAASGSVFRASNTNSTPKYEPPMPMHTTSVSFLPVWPTHSPLRTFSEKAFMPSNTLHTSGTTFLPSTQIEASRAARNATWSTGLPSVSLILTPSYIFFFLPSTSVACARANSFSMACWSTFSRQ